MKKTLTAIAVSSVLGVSSSSVLADDLPTCADILDAINNNNTMGGTYSTVHAALHDAMMSAIHEVQTVAPAYDPDGDGPLDPADQFGLGNHMWATINDRDSVICAVAFTGEDRGDQWPGSRVISAQKAYTSNAYSLDGFAVSTALLYASNLDGGGFYGLQFSNLMNPAVAYGSPSASGKAGSNPEKYGTEDDPMAGRILGGHIIFGGGFGIYNGEGILGGLGASGDTACYDHSFAWIVRDRLGLDNPPNNDNLQYDNQAGNVAGVIDGFEHVDCGFSEQAFVEALPTNYPLN